MKRKIKLLFILPFIFMQMQWAFAQDVLVNLAQIDGLDITPDNVLNFQVVSQLKAATHALVSGSIRYRSNTMSISYRFECTLQPGINMIHALGVHPQYVYSSPALRELFEDYQKLPEGIYQYCVSVKPNYSSGESVSNEENDCIYHKSTDVFLINLMDPENNAKIYEFNPMLSWTVNYPFAAQLQYRLRVVPINRGQNTIAAINRNNPVYDEQNLTQLSQVYPVYAKPLVINQPYAWTVDAYYKGILIGGAEPWMFTIVEDSLWKGISKDPAYVDIKLENSSYELYAPGILKLKYDLSELQTDSLLLQLTDINGKHVKFDETILKAEYGDNRFVINFYEKQPLKHLKSYILIITSQTRKEYRVLFKYVNPELIKESTNK